MFDTALHCVAILALWVVFRHSDPAFAAALLMYVREATQEQGKRYGWRVDNRSWFPWTWSAEKNFETWVPVGALLCVLVLTSFPAQAKQVTAIEYCYILRQNIEQVTSWDAATKDRIYWECKSRARDLKVMGELSMEESLRLRDAWALTVTPEMGDGDD